MPTSSSYEKPNWMLVVWVTFLFIHYGILPEISDFFAHHSWDGISILISISIFYRLYGGRSSRKEAGKPNAA